MFNEVLFQLSHLEGETVTTQNIIVISGVLIVNIALAVIWSNWDQIKIRLLKIDKYVPYVILLIFLSVWIFVFLIYKFPVSGDVKNFFIPQGEKVLQGFIPNRDFTSSYMPLFTYVLGAIYHLWPNEYSIGLFFTICLVIFIFIFSWLLNMILPKSHSKVTLIMLIGLLNSVLLILGIAYQQDECFILMLFSILIIVSQKKGDFFTGLVAGLFLCLTKITMIILLIPLYIFAKKKKFFFLGWGISTVLIIGYFITQGFSPMRMISGESNAIVPPSLITSFHLIPGVLKVIKINSNIVYIIAILVLVYSSYLLVKRKNLSFNSFPAVLIIIWLIFLLFSLKSLTSYRVLIIPFIPFVLDKFIDKQKKIPYSFAIYCSLVSIYMMFYEDWGKITKLSLNYFTLSQVQQTHYIILSVFELLIVLFEILWIYLALKSITSSKDEMKDQ